MESIIQLKKSEYDELVQLANLNKEEMQKKAQKIYENRGTYQINLELKVHQDYNDRISFKSFSYVSDWDKKFPISYEDKKRIAEFIQYRSLKMLEDKFGKQIRNVNFFQDEIEKLHILKMRFILFTIIGWLAAVLLAIIAIFH